MKLNDAKAKLDKIIGKPLGEFLTEDQLKDIVRNKGKTGQLLEIVLGLKNTSKGLDFEDGELKTHKVDKTGKPKETIFITQIKSIIDDLLDKTDFFGTHIYKKIANILFVPIYKDKNVPPEEWFFLPYTHVNLNEPIFEKIKTQLKEDYDSICDQLNRHIKEANDQFIHTSNGKLIQIRSKDSKPYHPIFSRIHKRNVSNKNHAFYFKKSLITMIHTVLKM